MERFDHVISAMCSIALARLGASIYGCSIWDEPHERKVLDACAHAEAVAVVDAEAGEVSCNPFSDSVLRECYQRALDVWLEAIFWRSAYPANPAGHTLYCSRGCNQLWTTAGFDECGACGQVMSPANEEAYYQRLIAAGQCL